MKLNISSGKLFIKLVQNAAKFSVETGPFENRHLLHSAHSLTEAGRLRQYVLAFAFALLLSTCPAWYPGATVLMTWHLPLAEWNCYKNNKNVTIIHSAPVVDQQRFPVQAYCSANRLLWGLLCTRQIKPTNHGNIRTVRPSDRMFHLWNCLTNFGLD